jgi:hypothetical protein
VLLQLFYCKTAGTGIHFSLNKYSGIPYFVQSMKPTALKGVVVFLFVHLEIKHGM